MADDVSTLKQFVYYDIKPESHHKLHINLLYVISNSVCYNQL